MEIVMVLLPSVLPLTLVVSIIGGLPLSIYVLALVVGVRVVEVLVVLHAWGAQTPAGLPRGGRKVKGREGGGRRKETFRDRACEKGKVNKRGWPLGAAGRPSDKLAKPNSTNQRETW